jgi:hypothetical protein
LPISAFALAAWTVQRLLSKIALQDLGTRQFYLLSAVVSLLTYQEADAGRRQDDAGISRDGQPLMQEQDAESRREPGAQRVIGETAPRGPRRIASVVTPKVTAIKQASPKAGSSSVLAGGRRRR